MERVNKKTQISKNYIYNIIYQVLNLITPLITTPYISRILQADGIGAYSYGLSIVTYYKLFGTLGVSTYGQLEIAKNQNDLEKYSSIFWEINLARFITMVIAGICYAVTVINSEKNKIVLLLLTFSLLAALVDISWFFQGLEDFKKIVTRNIIVKLIGVACIFLFVHKKSDLYLYIGLLQGIAFLANLTMWSYVPKMVLKPVVNLKNLWIHWKGSLAFFIPSLATTVYTVLDKSMIGWITDSNYENGYYEQAHRVEELVITFLTSFSGVFMPRMAFLFAQKEENQIRDNLKFSVNFILFLAMPMLFGLMGISSKLIPLFLGDGYAECIPLLNIFSMLLLAIGLNNVVGMQCLMPSGRQKQFNIGIICGACINLCMNMFAIKFFGAIGAAVSTVVAEFVILFIFMVYARNYMPYRIYGKPLLRYSLIGALMYVGIRVVDYYLPLNWYALFGEVIIGVAVYMGILLLIKDEIVKTVIQKLFDIVRRKSSR